MKNYLLLALAAVALCFTACKKDNPEPTPVAVTGVSLSKTMVGLEIDESVKIVATVLPKNATNKAVEWSVANTSVATVANGVVTGVAVGETTLTATTIDGGHTATIPVKVVTEKVAVTGIEWQGTASNIKEGKMAYFVAMISPENATDMSTIWESDNPEVASIGEIITEDNFVLAKITGIAPGKATISVTTNDGGFKRYRPITIDPIVKVTEINLWPTSAIIEAGQTQQFTATILPSNADNKEVEWSSSDTSIATVDATGKVTGIAVGEVTITVTAKDGSGVKGTALIEVTGAKPTSVTYNGSKNIDIVTWHGKKLEIVVDMEPVGADLRKLNWTKTLQTPHNPVKYSIEADRLIFESEPLGRYPYQFESCQHCIAYSTPDDYIFQIFARFRTKCEISRSADGMNSDGSINFSTFWDLIQIGLDGNEVAPALAMTMNAGTHYFVAWCPPSGQLPSSAAIYYPDAYIPTTEYTLTSDNAKWKVERVNDKLYKINDLDPTAYKEVVLTYTCGDFTFDQKFKVVPQ